MGVDGADTSVRQIDQVAGSMNRLADTVASVTRKLAATIGIGGGLAEIIQMSDQYTKYTSQLRLATQSQREFAVASADVKRIAKDSQAELMGTGVLYARIANGTRELGISQSRVAAITEVVNLSLKVSAATTAEAASAQLQLSQAFASGTLRGEEFNAVNEAAPRLMKALADGMGVPIGALKQMASDGQITSKMMSDVLPAALETLREEATHIQTIGGAFQVLKNNVMEFTATKAEANGTVAVLTAGLGLLANNLGLVAGLLTTMTAVKAGNWFVGWVSGTYATAMANRELRATTLLALEADVAATAAASALATARVAELRASVLAAEGVTALAITTNGLIPAQARAIALAEAHTVALAAQTSALAATAGGAGILRGALAFLGGPIGAIITVLGIAATAWSFMGSSAKEGAEKSAAAVRESTEEILAGLDKQIDKLRDRNKLARLGIPTGKNESAASTRLGEVVSAIDRAGNATGEYAGLNQDVRIEILKALGREYGDLTVKIAALNKEVDEDAGNKSKKSVGEWMTKYANNAEKLNTELEAARKELGAAFTPELEARIRKQFEAKATGTQKEVTAYATLTAAVREKIAGTAQEAAGLDTLNEAQKLQVVLDEQIRSGKLKMSASNKMVYEGLIKELGANLEVIKARKRNAEMDQIQAGYAEQLGKSLDTAIKEAEANVELARTFGMTKLAIAADTIARMEARLEQLRGIDMADDEVRALELLIDARKRSAAAIGSLEQKEANKKATDQQLKDQVSMWDSIDKTAHDTFVSIFDSGKSAFDRLRDTLKNGLLDLLYQMTVKKWIFNIGASVTGSGVAGVAQAAGSLASGGGVAGSNSLIGMAQAASGIYKAITGGFTSLSTAVADTVQATMYGTGMTDTLLTNGAFATSVGSAAAGAAGALAGHYIGNAIAGDYSVAHGQTVTNVASIVGAVMGGPVGGAIGGAIGGLINRAFGMGSTKLQSQGISGNISSNGLTGSSYQNLHQDGGWFRSDKNWTDKTSFSTEMVSQFTQGFDAIKAASTGFAAAVGASVESVAGYSKDFNISLSSDAAANEKAVTDFFTGVGNEIALRLVPNLAQFSKSGESVSTTLERLAGDFQATNQVAMLMGVNGKEMFGSLAIDSAAARERLIDLAGGVSNLSAQASTFAQNYLTEAERLAPVAEAVGAAMSSLGLASISTREQFKLTVQSLDVTTAAGAQQFASMMALADSFAQVHPLIDATTAAMRSQADILSEHNDLQKQYDQLTMTSAQLREKERATIDASNLALFDQITNRQAANATTDALNTMFDSLKSNRESLLSYTSTLKMGSLSTLTPMQKYLEAQSQYTESLAKAKASPADTAAQSAAQTAATSFLTASQVIYASSSAYVNDRAKVLGDMTSLTDIAGAQMTDVQQQLSLAGQQVSSLVTLNNTAAGIQQAIIDLGTSGGASGTVFDAQRYTAASSAGSDALVAEIKGLREQVKDLLALTKDRRDDARKQSNDQLGATEEVGAAIAGSVAKLGGESGWKARNPEKRLPR